LQVLAKKVVVKDGLIVPMLDARRMEVYSAIFDKSYSNIKEVQAEILKENSYSEITDTIYFIGDCQEKFKTVLTAANFHFLPEIVFPSANEMSALSFEKLINADFEDVAYFEPFYLKDFLITK
jgi:tRNA threonylcarbamoyladenosine biosynthesis protein TsaB